MVIVAAAVVVAVAQARDHTKAPVSWADPGHRFGWTVVTSGGPLIEGQSQRRCPRTQFTGGSVSYICATEDGGRSWHRIFQAGEGLIYIRDFTRTSETAGVVVISDTDALPKTLRTGVFWTADNGAHWYETTAISSATGIHVFHIGGELYWSIFRARRHRVRPWPPVPPDRCPGFFAWHPFDQHERATGNVCVHAVVNAGMRSQRA